MLGLAFATYVGLSMLVYSSSLLTAIVSDMDSLLFICAVSILGCFCILPMVIVANRYAAIACVRQLRAMIVADIGLESGLVVILLGIITLDTGSDHAMSRSAGVVM